MPNDDALTAGEVAAILRVNKATVYSLRSRGQLAAYTVGRKLRFTREDVEGYIAASHAQASGTYPPEAAVPALPKPPEGRPYVVSGRDVALDVLTNYLVQMDVLLQRSYLTCYDGLIALYRGEVQAAAVQLWDGETDGYNAPYVRRLVPGTRVALVRVLSQMQGLIVQRGNPKGLKGWEDIARPSVRVACRERGSSERVLLDGRLHRMGTAAPQIGYEMEATSPILLAGRVARGRADCVVGTEKTARQVTGVDFVPLQKAALDLVIKQEDYDTLPTRALVNVLESGMLRADLRGFVGYDTAEMGHVTWL
jgi:putative molybdopterin biosynthesis protein